MARTSVQHQRFHVTEWCILHICRAISALWWGFRLIAASLLPSDQDRAPARLPSPRFLSVGTEGELNGIDELPSVPDWPVDVDSIAFAGCANLSMYVAGAAFALQRSPGYKCGTVKVRGASSGAFVGAAFATNCCCADMMNVCRRRMTAQRKRFGGCIGIYSREIRGALQTILSRRRDPSTQVDCGVIGSAPCADGLLEVVITCFMPGPTGVVVDCFADDEELIDTVMASSYIPIAYELPVVLTRHGVAVDGCASSFFPQAALVVSPYHFHTGDITPDVEYPRSLIFNLQHSDDTLRLFEDGYLDAVAWLASRSPSRQPERLARTPEGQSSVGFVRAALGAVAEMMQ